MKPTDLTVEVRDRSLARIGQIAPTDYQLTVSPLSNAVGSWTLTLPKDHPMVPHLATPGSGIVVTDPYDVVISGPTSAPQSNVTLDDLGGSAVFSGVCDNQWIFDRLAYPDPSTADTMDQATDYDIRTGPAESVIRAYVDHNAGPSAPAERRVQGLTLEADGGSGGVVTKQARFDDLGDFITAIAAAENLRWRVVQRGSQLALEIHAIRDLSKSVRLDVASGTLDGRSVAITAPTGTKVIVGSLDVALDRLFATVTSDVADQSEQQWGRRIESFMDQAYAADEATWTQSAREQLATTAPTNVAVQATANSDSTLIFGRDWNIGDIVGIVVDGQEVSSTVTGLVLQVDADGVKIGAVLGDAAGFNPATANARQIAALHQRVSQLERVPTLTSLQAHGVAVEAQGTAETAQTTAVGAQSLASTAASDATAASAVASAAQATATVAASAAASAASAASTAQATADGKNTVTYSTSAPVAQANRAGDIWFVTGAGGLIVGQYQGTGGTSWTQLKLDHAVIASIDLGTATVGTLSGSQLSATAIDGKTITGATVQTGDASAPDRTVITASGTAKDVQFYSAIGGTQFGYVGSLAAYTNDTSKVPGSTYCETNTRFVGESAFGTGAGNTAAVELHSSSTFNAAKVLTASDSWVEMTKRLVCDSTVTAAGSVTGNKVFATSADTTTNAANVFLASGGQYQKVTSLGRHKLEQREITLDQARGALLLTPKTWFDRSEVEANGGSHDGLRRIAGLVAEDVEANAPELAVYDEQGNLQGVAYDRVPALVLPLVQDQQNRIEELEGEVSDLRDRLARLEALVNTLT